MTSEDKISVVIVIGEGFPIMSLTLVTEPLRIANRESSRPIFSWRIATPNGRKVRSSSGIAVPVDCGLDDRPADAVIVLASYFPSRMATDTLIDWLRHRAAAGALMGCVDTAALIFAEAGLLDRRAAAVHHEAIVGFRERHADRYFADQLFDIDGDRCSSAGGVATIDMTLGIIERFGTRSLARRVSEILNYAPLSSQKAVGAFGRDWSIPRLDRTLAKSIDIMMANIEEPVSIAEISTRVGWPVWKLRRLFQKHLNMSVQAYYLELRLDRARNLLRNSNEKVRTIAMMCGFPAAESLSRTYKSRYGISPSQDRELV